MPDSLRDRLRAIRASEAALPTFDIAAAPTDPLDLVREWLESAIEARVLQPTAMTLSTAGLDGAPSARTLLLKDVTADGLWFASLSTGLKGAQLSQNPRAALTFYWREQGRQIRVSGEARTGPREISDADFLARHPTARARAIAGEQSRPMPPRRDVEAMVAAARELLEAVPDFVPPTWEAWIVVPDSIEFWQAGAGHEEVRLGYRRDASGWEHELLWP